LRASTDVFVTSDHGFATISKREIDAQGHFTKSYSAGFDYLTNDGKPEVPRGSLPAGFLAVDLAHLLGLPLFDPDIQVTVDGAAHYAPVDPGKSGSTAASQQHPVAGNGLLGGTGAVQDRIDAKLIVTASGGSDLVYIANDDRTLARRVVQFLTEQDYVGALFVDPRFGQIPGALPLTAAALDGSTRMPRPSIVVSFKRFLLQAGDLLSAVQVADTPLQEGQGMHGGFGRDNTFNNMAAAGPDFKQSFIDALPVGNADIAPTLARVLGLKFPSVGKLQGRELTEALLGGPDSASVRQRTAVSTPTSSGQVTALHYQELQGRRYFDMACLTTASKRHFRRLCD
jgi:arylsulfatase A-like enzyme